MEQIDVEPYSFIATVFSEIFCYSQCLLGGCIVLFFLFLYTITSGIEASFFSISPFQSQQLREHEKRSVRIFSSMMERPVQLLSTILLTKVLSLFCIVRLFLWMNILQLSIIELLACIIPICLLIEFLIKKYAITACFKFIAFCAYPLYALFTIFYPVGILFSWIFGKDFGNNQKNVSLDEISDAIENVDVEIFEDYDDQEDARLLKGVVRFGETEAKEIMHSRNDVIAIEKSQPLETIFRTMLESGYTRFPVYNEDLDHILGIVVLKDFLPYLLGNKNFEWRSLIRPAFFVPENKMIDELLQEFQKKSIHLAIVVDEYGGTSGIVTLEDVLEEIVGEIGDEYDADTDKSYQQIDKNSWEFEAKTLISDFCKIVNLNDDYFDAVRNDTDSLGGLVLELMGKQPQKNEEVHYKKCSFKITELDHRRVLKLLITIAENGNTHHEDKA